MKYLLLTIMIFMVLISCQTTQKTCEFPDSYELIKAGNESSKGVDIYIGIGETNQANAELYANYGALVITPFPFADAIRALIGNGMLCEFLGHAPGLDNDCLLCGEELPLDSL